MDPFTFIEKDGYFYGRGTSDDKAMAAIFVANLIRLQAGRIRARSATSSLALTADEEGGSHNGVDWLLQNHRALIDAEFAINEGGGGHLKQRAAPPERGAGEREGLPRFHARGDESRRPQLAARQRERDLSARAGTRRGSGTFEFPAKLNEVTRAFFSKIGGVREGADRRPT